MSLIIDGDGGPEGNGQGARGELIKDSDIQNFANDVMEASKEVPVLVDFWAPWCGPCKTLSPLLEKIIQEFAGKVKLVKIDVDQNQQLAQQLRIQSIPTVYAFKDGQPVDAFQGALPESQLRSFINKLVGDEGSPVEMAVSQAQALIDQGDAQQADQLFAQILQAEPENPKALAGRVRARIAMDDKDTAQDIIDNLPDGIHNDPDIQQAKAAMELAETGDAAADSEELSTLAQKVEQNPDDLQARYDLAMAQTAAGQHEEAVDHLLHIVAADRDWNDGTAKDQLLKIFEALGPTNPVTQSGRRRLGSLLFV